jgi:uncharacterized membrane protein YkoI
MTRTTKIRGGIAAAIVALGIGGVAIAGATNGDDDGRDAPITGRELERASAAALAHTGDGRVTETELGDEEGYYEVEVTRSDGRQVDVHVTQDFTVLGATADGDEDGDMNDR